jgi:hypothetical protein
MGTAKTTQAAVRIVKNSHMGTAKTTQAAVRIVKNAHMGTAKTTQAAVRIVKNAPDKKKVPDPVPAGSERISAQLLALRAKHSHRLVVLEWLVMLYFLKQSGNLHVHTYHIL